MNPPRDLGRTALLCLVGGSADVIAFVRYGTFVGAMTGNTVLLGIDVVQGHLPAVLYHGVIIAAFLFAAILTSEMLGGKIPLIVPLALTAIMLGMSGLIASKWSAALSAAALGMQNAAVRRIGGVAVNTVFITGDLNRLGAAIPGAGEPRQYRTIVVLATAWIAYAAGAIVGAVALKEFFYPMMIPAVLAFMAAIVEAHVHHQNPPEEPA